MRYGQSILSFAGLALLAAAAVRPESRETAPAEPVVPETYPEDPAEPPRRLHIDPSSPHYHPCVKRIGVMFNGLRRRGDVVEYDVEEGWIRIHKRNRKGQVLKNGNEWVTVQLKGLVEPYYIENLPNVGEFRQRNLRDQSAALDVVRITRAEQKRARKAAKLERNHASQA